MTAALNTEGSPIQDGRHETGETQRVALVTNIPTPYRVPLFNVLSRRLAAEGRDLRVFFCARGYRRRTWSDPLVEAHFDYEVLHSVVFQRKERALMLPLDLNHRLGHFAPRVVIVGGMSAATLSVSVFSSRRRTPYVIWSGEVAKCAVNDGRAKRSLRATLARRASAFVAYGSEAGRYLSALAPDAPVFIAWNTVDLDYFTREAAERRRDMLQLDGALGEPANTINVLTVGYLYAGKGIDLLLEAIARVRSDQGHRIVLHVVGDGPERARLEVLAGALELGGRVRFWGDQSKADMPKFYAQADIFAFPTLYDIWGLVLVEAMASGLASVASSHAGATVDLIEDGVTGLVVDPQDVDAFARTIERLSSDAHLRERLGSQACNFVCERLTLERSADGFARAVEAVM